MKYTLKLFALSAVLFFSNSFMQAKVFSFEDGLIPSGFSVSEGNVSLSREKFKHGANSLRVDWKAGSVLTMSRPDGIEAASKSRNGGMNLWIYNSVPSDSDIVFSFCDRNGRELCRLPFHIGFSGWRCIWAKFRNDMGMPSDGEICSVRVLFPETGEGCVWLDLMEFTPTVSWQNMSDAQYEVNRTDFALIPDFNRYRNAEPCSGDVISSSDEDIRTISSRLEEWYLGSGNKPADGFVSARIKAEKSFVAGGVEKYRKYTPGTPLFPHAAPYEIEGEKIVKFRDLNEGVLIPLALDWRKNGNTESRDAVLEIYDWFNDQGWADGSGLGTLTFEKLRSSGYFHSFFLLKDRLSGEKLRRELNTINWMSLFGICYMEPLSKGEVADNLRALAIPKLIYALSLPDKGEREVAMTAYKHYLDNALGLAPGYFGTFKPDYSGYHHRGPYHSAYYNHALYAGAFLAYLLHGTAYQLDAETLDNIKNGLLSFRFFSAGLDVPAGTVGRFPEKQQVLQELVPAFAYAALSYPEPDRELVAAMKKIVDSVDGKAAVMEYAKNANSSLAYTSTVGEMELVAKVSALDIPAEAAPEGSVFMPYSGMLVSKDRDMQFNAKGFSKYIWDFESSATENLHGRYLAYGHLEYFDFRNGNKSFHPEKKGYDWNYISGTTTRVLPADLLLDKGGSSSGHRNFSDESFLAGVSATGETSMFSVRLHDIAYDTTFRADKSVFVFKDWLFCLGSGITCGDAEHPVVTTVYQKFDGNASVKTLGNGVLAEDASFLYAVSGGDVRTEGGKAFISHGVRPSDGGYRYFILRDKDRKEARRLLSSRCPVEVLKADNEAHIIYNSDEGILCGALFDASVPYGDVTGAAGCAVAGANIPLAFVFEKTGGGAVLSVCEPDMRRPAVKHMGLLTEADVIVPEKAFGTEIYLKGHWACEGEGVTVGYDSAKDITTLAFSTIRGENHRMELFRIK